LALNGQLGFITKLRNFDDFFRGWRRLVVFLGTFKKYQAPPFIAILRQSEHLSPRFIDIAQ
jgi:hypothetical protein